MNRCLWCWNEIPYRKKFCSIEHGTLYRKHYLEYVQFQQAKDILRDENVLVDAISIQHLPRKAIIRFVQAIGYKWNDKKRLFERT